MGERSPGASKAHLAWCTACDWTGPAEDTIEDTWDACWIGCPACGGLAECPDDPEPASALIAQAEQGGSHGR